VIMHGRDVPSIAAGQRLGLTFGTPQATRSCSGFLIRQVGKL
jgi:hypothetical protein